MCTSGFTAVNRCLQVPKGTERLKDLSDPVVLKWAEGERSRGGPKFTGRCVCLEEIGEA